MNAAEGRAGSTHVRCDLESAGGGDCQGGRKDPPRGRTGRTRLSTQRKGCPEVVLQGFFVAWALLTAAFDAGAAQAVGGVRVVDEPYDGGLRLLVDNANLAAVTLTLTVVGDNAVTDPPTPTIVSCSGKGRFPFVILRPVEGQRDFGYRVKYDWQFGAATVTHNPQAVYELPFAPGKRFRVAQGHHGSFTHTGNNEFAVDFEMPVGTPVHAARAGVVEVVVDRFKEGGENPEFRDRVNLILVRHADGTYGEYVHLKPNGAKVKLGQKVAAREVIGLSGNTGYTQGPHLHFAVFRTLDGMARETMPVRFRAREGNAVEPVEGEGYTAR